MISSSVFAEMRLIKATKAKRNTMVFIVLE